VVFKISPVRFDFLFVCKSLSLYDMGREGVDSSFLIATFFPLDDFDESDDCDESDDEESSDEDDDDDDDELDLEDSDGLDW
jgi:hypothetical protein